MLGFFSELAAKKAERGREAVEFLDQAIADDLKSMPVDRAERLVVAFSRLVALHPRGMKLFPDSLLPAPKVEMKQAFCLVYRLLMRRNDKDNLTLIRHVYPELARYQAYAPEGPRYPRPPAPEDGMPVDANALPGEDQLLRALKAIPLPDRRAHERWMKMVDVELKLFRRQLDDVHEEESRLLREAVRYVAS